MTIEEMTEAERIAYARIATEWMAGPYGLPKFPVEEVGE